MHMHTRQHIHSTAQDTRYVKSSTLACEYLRYSVSGTRTHARTQTQMLMVNRKAARTTRPGRPSGREYVMFARGRLCMLEAQQASPVVVDVVLASRGAALPHDASPSPARRETLWRVELVRTRPRLEGAHHEALLLPLLRCYRALWVKRSRSR